MDEHWLVIAKTLRAGERRKIAHCGKDKTMNIWNGDSGYASYCHRCKEAPFVKHGQFSINKLAKRRAEKEIVNASSYHLPADYVADVPAAEATWFYKAGISPDLARAFKFGWSPGLQRIIIPIGTSGEFIARSRLDRPKYIQKVREDTLFLATPDMADAALPTEDVYQFHLVVTEDLLSAVRVGRYVPCLSILGTSINSTLLRTIRATVDRLYALRSPDTIRIGVWLDPDAAGKQGSARALRTLALQGYEVSYIKSSMDPKYYSNAEIRRYLARHQSIETDAQAEGL